MSMHNLIKMVVRAFSDQVTNFTVDPERIVVADEAVNPKAGLMEIVFDLPEGASLFYDGGDREKILPSGGKVLALYDREDDLWGWYLFNSDVLGEFTLSAAA